MHICHVFPRFKEVHGGAEPVIFNLLRGLSDLGCANTLVTSHIPGRLRGEVDPRVSLRVPPRSLSPQPSNVLLAGFANLIATSLLPAFIPKEADVICFHTETVVPALFTYRALLGRKPSLYFCYQPPRFAYDTARETARSGGLVGRLVPVFSRIYRPFDRYTVRRADRVMAFSTPYRDWIESIYGVSDVAVLPPGVRKPAETPQLPRSAADRIGARRPVLLFTGKLIPWKNVDRLINVTAILRERFPDILCVVVGDGPSMPSLTEQVRRMGMEDAVLFAGYVGAEDVFPFYAAADLFLILERNISFGLCLVEANSCGVPVVAFRSGGPLDIVRDGQNGFLVEPDADDEAIAAVARSYLEREGEHEAHRRHALEAASRFTWERFASAFLATAEGAALKGGGAGRDGGAR